MSKGEIIWKDEYCIGVDYVDKAHKKLFELVSDISNVMDSHNYDNEGYACMQAINFLKSYTILHFKEEEGYMLQIGYQGYYNHKAIHDNLKEVVLPEFEKRLSESQFAPEVVEEFVALITGWLFGHILIEDLAITGKVASRYKKYSNDVKMTLRKEIERFGRDFIRINAVLADAEYEGRKVSNAMYYEMVYKEGYTVTVIADKRIITQIATNITGVKLTEITKMALIEYVQIIQSIAKGALYLIEKEDSFELISHRVFEAEELSEKFLVSLPEYSMLWNSELGELALCILKQ